MEDKSLSFDAFRAHVDRYISRRIGVSLEDLADVDIWDWYTEESAPVSWWKIQIKEAAQFVMESQDCVDSDLLSLFD